MGRTDYIIEGYEFDVFRWFFFENVESRPRDFSRFDGFKKVFLVDDTTAGAIDNEHTFLHFREGIGVYHPFRLFCTRGVHGDKVRLLQQFIQCDEHDAKFSGCVRGDKGVIGDDVHLQTLRSVGDNRADAPDSDDAQGLVVELSTHKFILLPVA